MSDKPNILKEAIIKSPGLGEAYWKETLEKARGNPFTNAYIEQVLKEGLTSDVAGALGRMHDVVVEAAKPALIGRELIWVLPTKDAMVRFPKAKLATAHKTAEFASYWLTGEKYDTEDVKADIEIKAGCEYSKRFFEDATWPVLERQTAEIGRAVAQLETKAIYDYLVANAGTAITGDSDGVLEWIGTAATPEFLGLWNALKKINWNPNVVALHPDEIMDLWADDKFINSFYFGKEIDVARGVLGSSYLGMKVVSSSLCTAGTVLSVDTNVAAVMLLRRDVITEPFENPKADRYGIVASERIGLGALRKTAIGKLTSI